MIHSFVNPCQNRAITALPVFSGVLICVLESRHTTNNILLDVCRWKKKYFFLSVIKQDIFFALCTYIKYINELAGIPVDFSFEPKNKLGSYIKDY
jgi:hypothetical protein